MAKAAGKTTEKAAEKNAEKAAGKAAEKTAQKPEKAAEKTAQKPEKAKPAEKLQVKEPRLKILYREKVLKALLEEFGYSSIMQVPKLEKIIVSMGVGEAIQNKKLLDAAAKELTQITGMMVVPSLKLPALPLMTTTQSFSRTFA